VLRHSHWERAELSAFLPSSTCSSARGTDTASIRWSWRRTSIPRILSFAWSAFSLSIFDFIHTCTSPPGRRHTDAAWGKILRTSWSSSCAGFLATPSFSYLTLIVFLSLAFWLRDVCPAEGAGRDCIGRRASGGHVCVGDWRGGSRRLLSRLAGLNSFQHRAFDDVLEGGLAFLSELLQSWQQLSK
jgi:hypothetical protein